MAKKLKHEIQMTQLSLSELDQDDRNLIQRAQETLDDAYAPYSDFKVGCGLLLEDNTVITGNNQENAAYPSGLCAERVALFHAGANHKGKKILKMAIAARPAQSEEYVQAGPCGSCRQVMLEYQSMQEESIEVLLLQPDDEVLKVSVEQLLPLAFDKSSFKISKRAN